MDELCFPNSPAADQHPLPLWDFHSTHKPVRCRKSFSSVEESLGFGLPLRKDDGLTSPALSDERASMRRIGVEERMDMLWEEFNELELSEIQSLDAVIAPSGCSSMRWLVALGESKSGRRLHRRTQSPGLLFILKVLKKLFVVQKTSPSMRRYQSTNTE